MISLEMVPLRKDGKLQNCWIVRYIDLTNMVDKQKIFEALINAGQFIIHYLSDLETYVAGKPKEDVGSRPWVWEQS